MPINIPPNLSTSQYEHLVLQALSEIAGPGANITSIPSILSTSDFRHLVLYALNYIAANGSGTSVAENLEFLARNGTGATIPKGSIVYINGAVSGIPRITLAQANNDTNSARTIGFAKTDIPDGSNGLVITQGELDNVKTLGIGAGIQLYLSPTTPGAFTQTKPVAPQHLVYVGVVITASTGSNFDGRILVGIQNGYELDELHDVLITGELANQSLARNTANTLWVNKFVSTSIYGAHRTALNPAIAGQTYYFGYPDDLAAVVTATERGFRFPYAGTVVGANLTISVTGTLGAGAITQGVVGLFNKTTSTFSPFNFGQLNYASAMTSYRASGLSIAVNTTSEYTFYITTPNFTGGIVPTSTRHYANLFYV